MRSFDNNTLKVSIAKEKSNNISPHDQLIQSGLDNKSFNYLTAKTSKDAFEFTKETIEAPLSNLSQYMNQHTLYILTIIPEDTLSESTNLHQTLSSISANANSLGKTGITMSSILYVIIFQKISNKENHERLFKPSSNNQAPSNPLSDSSFNASFMEYNSNISDPLQLLIIHRPNVSHIESLNLFYINILNQLKSKETLVNVFQISNGVIISDTCISDMIALSNNKAIGVVPFIETIPNGLFSNIEHYSNFQFNIFDMYYYYIACCVPLNHLVYLLRVNSPIQENIKMYFSNKICLDSTVDYHDFLFSLFLTSQGYQITLSKNIICKYSRNQITFDQMMQEYTGKQGGIYASVIDILKFWCECSSFDQNCLRKFVLFFLLIGMFFDFCFPSMMAIVVYATIMEAFNSIHDTGAKFFTSVYLILTFISIAFSLIKKIDNKYTSYKIYLYLYGAFSIFYYFILICSIPAMHYINIDTSSNSYMFDFGALSTLIILNFLIGITPLLMNIKACFSNIVSSLLYLVVGASGYTSLFLNYSIVNSVDQIGTIKGKNGYKDRSMENTRKGIVIVIYALANAIFLCVLFGMNTRAERANGVLALAIIYTIYNFIKLFAIIGGICKSPVQSPQKEDGELNRNNINNDLRTKEINEISSKKEEESNNNNYDYDYDKRNPIIQSKDQEFKKPIDLSVEGINSGEQGNNTNKTASNNGDSKSIEIQFDDNGNNGNENEYEYQ